MEIKEQVTKPKQLRKSQLFALSIQHVVSMVVGCITVPIIASSVARLNTENRIAMIQASLLSAGIAVLIQALDKRKIIGSGLPVIVGSGFAFIAVMSSVAVNYGISYVFGAQLIASLCGLLFGFFYRYIKILFAPIVKAVVVMTIGISLSSTAVDYLAGSINSKFYGTPKSWALGIFTLVITIIYSHYGKGIIKAASTLLGLITGYVTGLVFNLVHFDSMIDQPTFRILKPFSFGLDFHLAAIVPFVIITLISAVQDMGQIEATTHGLWGRSAHDAEIRGGIIGDNLGTLIGAVFGGAPNAIAGQNVGIVVTTQIIDKLVFVLAGGMLILIGFFPRVAAGFLTIPYSVLGGATIAVFGSIATTGMKMLAAAGMSKRNLSIAGLSLAIAIGITYHGDAFSQFPNWVYSIFGNAIVLSALVSIVLNLTLPQEK